MGRTLPALHPHPVLQSFERGSKSAASKLILVSLAASLLSLLSLYQLEIRLWLREQIFGKREQPPWHMHLIPSGAAKFFCRRPIETTTLLQRYAPSELLSYFRCCRLLQNNSFSGAIPADLANLTSLTYL